MDPLRIAIANDYEIVVEGLAQMLRPFEDRVRVVETVANEPVSQDVDIVLYDNFGQPHHKGLDLDVLLSQARARHLVIYTWHIDPALVDIALDIGATGYLPKNLTADELVSALERINAGEVVAPETSPDPQPGSGDWPGRTFGLSERESEIIALITQGLTQRADRGPRLPQHQHGEVLHPHRLPQDGRPQPQPGGALGHRPRLPSRPAPQDGPRRRGLTC